MDTHNYILELDGVSKTFGGLRAISALTFRVPRERICALIGPNGAGKTTAVNLITGIYRPTHGQIYFEGCRLNDKKPHHLAHMGIARTFQNLQIFHDMTVRENVMVGFHNQNSFGFIRCLLHTPRVRRHERDIRRQTDGVLAFIGLEDKADVPAAQLSYGDQKRVEIARAVATGAQLLLLDEPVAGLNHQETEAMSQTILKIRQRGVTIILIEHDMNLIMGISDMITVINYGRKIAEGTPHVIQNDPKVIEAYLGREC